MKKKKVAAIICSTLIVAGCILSLFEESYSGIADIDPSWDTVEGTILTSDGTVICECTEDHHRGTVRSPEIYGSLLGHNSEGYGRSGLRRLLADKLYATDEKKPARGNDVVLTINDSVQTFAYNLMLPFSKRGQDSNACAVCIENKTGRIVGLVSIKAPLKSNDNETIVYDVNDIGAFNKKIEETNTNIPDAYYLPEWSLAKTPGSVFKCISAVPIIEKGLDKESFTDLGTVSFPPDIRIHNYEGYSYGDISLKGALEHSSNCYFSSTYYNKLSKGALGEIFDRCLIGKPIELDFTTLKSKYDLSNQSAYIMSTFGQCTVSSTLQTCFLLSGILNGTGVVKKPYLIEKVVSPKGKCKEEGKTTDLTEITDKDTASTLCSYLQTTAAGYGFNDGVYMKTGTAEITDGTQNYCFCGNKEYTVLVSVHNLVGKSQELKEASHTLLQYTTGSCMDLDEAQNAYAKSSEIDQESWFDQIIHAFSKKEDPAESKRGWFSTLISFFKS